MATEQRSSAYLNSSPPSASSEHNFVYQNGVHEPHTMAVQNSVSAATGSLPSVSVTKYEDSKVSWSQEPKRAQKSVLQQTQAESTEVSHTEGNLSQQHNGVGNFSNGATIEIQNHTSRNATSLPVTQQSHSHHQQSEQLERPQVPYNPQQGYLHQRPRQHRKDSFESSEKNQFGNVYSSTSPPSSAPIGGMSLMPGSQAQLRAGGVPSMVPGPVADASSSLLSSSSSSSNSFPSSSSFSVTPAPTTANLPVHNNVSAFTNRSAFGGNSAFSNDTGTAPGYYKKAVGTGLSSGATSATTVAASHSTPNAVWQSPFGAAAAGGAPPAQGSGGSFHATFVSRGGSHDSTHVPPPGMHISSSSSSIDHQAAGGVPRGDNTRIEDRVFTAAKMSVLTAAAAAAGAAATGGGQEEVQRMMMEAMFSSVRQNLSSEAAERVSQLQKWFPSLISTLRPYFCVTQTSVRKRLLQLIFPLAALFPTPKKHLHASSFDNLQHATCPTDCSGPEYDNTDTSGHYVGGTTSSIRTTTGTSGSVAMGYGLKFGRDLYTPSMALITYVLLYALSRADDFQPELLGSTMSLALVLLAAEVLAAKLALYSVGAPSVPTLDMLSFCGYKYVNLVIILLFRLLMEALVLRDAAVSFPTSSSSSSSPSTSITAEQNSNNNSSMFGAGSMGKMEVANNAERGGLTGALGNSAERITTEETMSGSFTNTFATDAAGAAVKPAMRALALLSAVPPSILEKSTWLYLFNAVYVYMCVCAAAEMVVLLRVAAAAATEKAAAAAAWGGSPYRSTRAQQYVYGGLALAQIPLCWLLMPSFSRHKKVI